MIQRKEKFKETLLDSVFILLTSLLIYYYVEAIYFQSFSSALSFILSNADMKVNFLNQIMILIFELAIYLFTNNYSISFGITSICGCMLAIINELKMSARGEAFTFSDILVAKEALLVAGNYNLKISRTDLMVIFLSLFLIILFIFLSKMKKSKKEITLSRRIYGFICTGILIISWHCAVNIVEFVKGQADSIFIVSSYYDENGILLGLARTTPHKLQPPADYSQERITALQENIINNNIVENRPNVIFVMNESLYDISDLNGATFNKDPLEKLKDLQKKYTFGTLISPTSGGGTCNVEFEVLTGCSISDIGNNAMPYSDMIHNNITSLISLLNQNGYYTTAFHPNTGTYFNRRNVYMYMQFDEAHFSEEMGMLPLEGQYASDLELYKEVIRNFENKPADTPFFSYVITMQNHGGYSYKYDGRDIKILSNSKFANEEALETFINLEFSSINAFEYLITYFDKVDEPTVIIMFGDHCPGLPEFDYQFDEADADVLKFRVTPLIVYNNYNLPYEEWGYVNSYNLASKVLDYCGIKRDAFFEYQLQALNVPSLAQNYYINEEWVDCTSVDSIYTEYKHNLWLLSYDRVFGKEYGVWNNE